MIRSSDSAVEVIAAASLVCVSALTGRAAAVQFGDQLRCQQRFAHATATAGILWAVAAGGVCHEARACLRW
jgi:hypothetical protein